MAFDLNKLSQMAKSRSDEAKQKATDRKHNREWLRISQDIALALHYYLRTMKITQKELANRMQVTPTILGFLLIVLIKWFPPSPYISPSPLIAITVNFGFVAFIAVAGGSALPCKPLNTLQSI
jgi:hypothetical protein